MTGSALEDLAAPESWESADLDAVMSRLTLSSSSEKDTVKQEEVPAPLASVETPASASVSALATSTTDKVSDDVINQVDQFLREALQNPRERVSVLRIEQDVEKFIRDPTQQQMEFQQLPTSYLRLAAHRIAQHYSLQSMVLLDSSLPDGSGSRIIVRKTSECRLPAIRLADIPVNLPSEDRVVLKVAIKQRPQKQSSVLSSSGSNSVKTNVSKSVDERKEEYNRARARIFNSSGGHGGRPETEHRLQDGSHVGPSRMSSMDEKSASGASDIYPTRSLVDSSASISRTSGSRDKPNNRVAIFRDRETDCKDPDYDRSYDRYMQHFDPGFGLNSGPYTIRPMFTPALNYNSEFPQLGSTPRPQISAEHQPRPLPQHLSGPWASQPIPAGIAYCHPDTMVPPFSPSHVGTRTPSVLYMHTSQFPCQHPGMPFIHPPEQVHQPFAQFHQPHTDASFRLDRPR